MATHIGEGTIISEFARIDVSHRGTNTTLGKDCRVDDFVKVKHVGGEGHIIIKDRVYINSGCVLYSGNGISIGSDVLIGPNCNIVPVNHEFSDPNRSILSQRFQSSKGGILIEDDVWIGAGVTLLDGTIIRKGTVIAAGAVVRGEFPPFAIIGGVPAVLLKMRI